MRGQQALEYLITYGWAFIVVIVTIGAFAYFGILNPQQYVPDRCDFGVQLQCSDYLLEARDSTAGMVRLKLTNSFGEDIRLTDVSTASGGGVFCGPLVEGESLCGSDRSYFVLPVGETRTVNLSLEGEPEYTLLEGEKTLVPVRVNFTRDADSAPAHSLIGEVFATAQG